MKIYEQNCFAIKSCFPAAFLLSLSHCCVTESKWCTEREKKIRLSTPNFLFESSFHIQMELKNPCTYVWKSCVWVFCHAYKTRLLLVDQIES